MKYKETLYNLMDDYNKIVSKQNSESFLTIKFELEESVEIYSYEGFNKIEFSLKEGRRTLFKRDVLLTKVEDNEQKEEIMNSVLESFCKECLLILINKGLLELKNYEYTG